MRQRYHSTMNNSVQKYNRATNGNKAAYLILGIYISAVFDKVIMHGSYMHARLAILQRQYHHPTQQQAAAVVTVGKYRDQTTGLHINDGGGGQRDHRTMKNSMQEYNRATNGNKAAYIILGVHISTVFDKVLDNRQVLPFRRHMHGRPAILQQQYHHTTYNKQQQ